MNSLKAVYKRVSPLLGTFVELSLNSQEPDKEEKEVISDAFTYARSLENIFNIHDSESEISKLNLSSTTTDTSQTLAEAIAIAHKIRVLSSDAFYPFRKDSTQWDLNGMAKGFIVDKLVEYIKERIFHSAGIVNAGGDMRFFNTAEKEITLRMGLTDSPLFRNMKISRNAVASSSVSRSLQDPKSSTHYHKSLRPGVQINDTVVVISDSCVVADALTKVGLFAKPENIARCAQELNSEIILFNDQGEPVEVFSSYENQQFS